MCGGVRGAPLQDRHALHVLLHAIEEVVHVSFVRQAEAPALALQPRAPCTASSIAISA